MSPIKVMRSPRWKLNLSARSWPMTVPVRSRMKACFWSSGIFSSPNMVKSFGVEPEKLFTIFGLLLVFGYFQLAKYGEELLRLDAEAGEEVLGIAGVLIRAVEPLRGHEFLYAGHLADALAVKQWDGDG